MSVVTPGFLAWATERIELSFSKAGQAGYGRDGKVCREK